MFFIMILLAFILTIGPRISPNVILKMHKARPLAPYQAGDMFHLTQLFAKRAGLSYTPQLFWIPSGGMNAFAIKLNKHQHGIALTAGLLSKLHPHELAAVIAHELSHIRNKDTAVMQFAAVVSHLTASLAGFAKILLVFNLVLVIVTGTMLNWFPLVLMAMAPIASTMLHLALSRTREFNADLGAAALTGDPQALASALKKLDVQEQNLLQRLFLRPRHQSDWLKTHPASSERIKRLHALRAQPAVHQSNMFWPYSQQNTRPEPSRFHNHFPNSFLL